MGEDKKFINYIPLALQPQYRPFSKDIIKSYAFIIFNEYKTKLLSYLPTLSSKIAITSNVWTDITCSESYMCDIGSMMNEIYKKRILSFKQIEWLVIY